VSRPPFERYSHPERHSYHEKHSCRAGPDGAYVTPVPPNQLLAAKLITPEEALAGVPADQSYPLGLAGRRKFLALKFTAPRVSPLGWCNSGSCS
jgi:hypothetical protein